MIHTRLDLLYHSISSSNFEIYLVYSLCNDYVIGSIRALLEICCVILFLLFSDQEQI
jgi:hypothetical protein